MTDSFLTVDGTPIHYRLDGHEGAPVLVLSNSLGTDLSMWDAQIPAFARAFRVLRYDTRGHGQSGRGGEPCTIERLGLDVVGLLDGLAIGRAHCCGISMGGMTGMWLGVHAAHRVAKLALCNTSAHIGPPERWNTRIDAVRAGGMTAIVQAVIGAWFTPEFFAREPAVTGAIRLQLERMSPEGYIAACAAIRDMDQRDAIGAIRAPTLVVTGSRDGATPPAEGRFLAGRIPGARHVELDAAHLSNIEAASGFNEALVSFLLA
jgi:3-oxoadipate enol-lactonase